MRGILSLLLLVFTVRLVTAQVNKRVEFTSIEAGGGFGRNIQHVSVSVSRNMGLGKEEAFTVFSGVELSSFWNTSDLNFSKDIKWISVTPHISFNRVSANIIVGVRAKITPKIIIGLTTGIFGINYFNVLSDRINVFYYQQGYDSIGTQSSKSVYEQAASIKKSDVNALNQRCMKSEISVGYRIKKNVNFNLTCGLVVTNLTLYAQNPFVSYINQYGFISRLFTGGLCVTYYFSPG